jgi:hypothetical protein
MPCQLCGAEKVYHIQSHYSPRSITKGTFGDNEKEEIYSISPLKGTVDIYMGRANPKAVEGNVKGLPNAGKGIFCKKCEDAFGKLENICQAPLNKSLDDLYAGNFKPKRVREELKAFSISIPSNIMQLFIYTVVWRQCLQNKTEVGDGVLSVEEYNFLQSILLREIYKDSKNIEKSDFSNFPRISIFTSKLNRDRDGWANVSPYKTNPELFFLGKYHILYFKNGRFVNKNLFSILGLPTFVLNPDINLQHNHDKSIIGVVPLRIHEGLSLSLATKTADDMKMTFYTKVAIHRHISLREAVRLTHEKADEIKKEIQSDNYTECFIKAAEILCR